MPTIKTENGFDEYCWPRPGLANSIHRQVNFNLPIIQIEAILMSPLAVKKVPPVIHLLLHQIYFVVAKESTCFEVKVVVVHFTCRRKPVKLTLYFALSLSLPHNE